jgi:hypothetical protein
VQPGFAERFLESVLEALDQTGTDLMAATRDPNRRADWSWLKRAVQPVTRQVAALRQKRPSSESSAASRRGTVVLPRPVGRADRPTVTTINTLPAAVLAGLVAIGTMAFCLWRLRRQPATERNAGATFSLASPLRHDGDVVRACHQLARYRWGSPSRFWHHRRLFAALAAASPPQLAGSVAALSRAYEQARYAPCGGRPGGPDDGQIDRALADLRAALTAAEFAGRREPRVPANVGAHSLGSAKPDAHDPDRQQAAGMLGTPGRRRAFPQGSLE